eukprot:CAMPEP_0182533174 /NCGR_PEP_ID=MMETSP1323-20130603/13255_1 /TAXON_ID=236787 /ORGANISM="Florenciella parvula, Strain RCC1693" /LENGTH=103 /DNA_ID=CAMNT_0024743027 /DNA_START=283 /DNA_END=594 /DNA_ORIENTATION=+
MDLDEMHMDPVRALDEGRSAERGMGSAELRMIVEADDADDCVERALAVSLSNRFMDATRATTVAGVVEMVRSFLATEVDERRSVPALPCARDAGGGRAVQVAD